MLKMSLIKKLILFFLPLFILFFFIEKRLAKIPHPFKEVKSQFEPYLSKARVMMAGTSHLYEVKANYFNIQIANLATQGQNLEVSSQLIEKYLDKMPNAKTILMEIPYFGLDYLPEEQPLNYYHHLIHGISGTDRSLKAFLDIRFYSWFALYGPAMAIDAIRSDFFKKETPIPESPSIACLSSIASMSETGQKRANYHEKLRQEKNRTVILKHIERILKIASNRDIRVTFVTTPVSQYYHQHIEPSAWRSIRADLARFEDKYLTSHLDYFSDPRFDDCDFYDPDHLNSKGAQKLAAMLEKKLTSPLALK